MSSTIQQALRDYEQWQSGDKTSPTRPPTSGSGPGCCFNPGGYNYCYISCNGCGNSGDSKACLILVAFVAAFSAVIFAGLSAKTYGEAAEYGSCKREAKHDDPQVRRNIKRLYQGMEAERALVATAFLCAAIAAGLLIAACTYGGLERGPYIQLAIGSGATAGGACGFGALSTITDPKRAAEALRQNQKAPAKEVVEEATPVNGKPKPVRRAPTPTAPHEPPPDYSRELPVGHTRPI